MMVKKTFESGAEIFSPGTGQKCVQSFGMKTWRKDTTCGAFGYFGSGASHTTLQECGLELCGSY